jgi:hypothetical protein
MRCLISAALAPALVLALCGTGQAQELPKVRIDDNGVRVGFLSPGGDAGSKTGFWAPVYVALTAGRDRVGPADGWVIIHTNDSDDMENVYRVPLPPLEPGEQRTVVAYVRTGATGSEVNVAIRLADGKTVSAQRNGKTATGYGAAAPGTFLYVTAGSNANASMISLQRALLPQKPGGDEEADVTGDATHLTNFAYINQVRDLPTRWFGYHAVDVLILGTSDAHFVEELLKDTEKRKEALGEWVRRGGRLVLSVGRQHQLVNTLLEQTQLFPCKLGGQVQRQSLPGVSSWAKTERWVARPPRNRPGNEPVPLDIVKIELLPGKGVQILADEVDEKDRDRWPVVVQSAVGLGRVVLVGFDLDAPPFTDWEGRGRFWQKLSNDFRPNAEAEKNQNQNFNANFGGPGGMPGWDSSHNDVGTLMQDRLEDFKEVPVISFGWVALFILVYILVVGPLDYFFLKKVVKRLELTWITFPTVVLVVSALAYVTAYYLKGNDLRINKVDVVDIVAELPEAEAGAPQIAQGARAYGATWFTIFSPRIQNYTVSIEPGTGSWVPEPDKSAPPNPHSVVVSWMGRPETAWGGGGRGAGSPSLFRRAYDYAPDASGLVGVPIQVWSTKSFTGTWQAALAEDKPLIRAELKHTRGERGEHLTGSITSELPVDLEGVVLFYQGKGYKLDTLSSGVAKKLEPPMNLLSSGENGISLENWFADIHIPANNNNNPWQQRSRTNVMQSAQGIVKDLMFGEKDTGGNHARNTTLRYLDESWRLNRPGEAIVVGRLPRLEEGAEQVSQNPVSPSRIWLGQLPEVGKPRPALAGKMTQEAYVRIFIPVITK